MSKLVSLVFWLLACTAAVGQTDVRVVPIAEGWAQTTVNAVIFRWNSLVSHEGWQYASFYDADAQVVLAKRRLGSDEWEIRETGLTGNARDAHNAICIMVDGEGYLHVSWDHHGHPLRYCRSVEPGSLELTEKLPMTGERESRVTYPEFYRLADGDLLFAYRDGASGNGDLMLNHYDTDTQTWTRRADGFIDGEGARNAYWQMCVDGAGTVHVSWVWRETGDVKTNHDLCYARSRNGGRTWERSTGEAYALPITAANAEYVLRIPQGSDLMNTNSICADGAGRPYTVSYWTPQGERVPQYQLAWHDGERWRVSQIGERTEEFHLGGAGTRRTPISRCKVLIGGREGREVVYAVFKDIERGNGVTVASCSDLEGGLWEFVDLHDGAMRRWEPTYDTELWREAGELHLLLQSVGRGPGDGEGETPPQMVSVLEWIPG